MAQGTETLVATGVLPFLMLASAALTVPVALALLRLYRRAVVRAMASQAGIAAPPAVAGARAVAQPPPLDIELFDAAALDAAELPQYRRAVSSLTRATIVYVAAGFAYAIALTSPWLVFMPAPAVPVARTLWLMSCYLWPAALAVGMLTAVSRGQRALVGVAYFAMLFAVALYGVARNEELTVGQLATFWLLTNAPATLLLIAFLHRRVRAVGPLVLAFMITAVTGSHVLVSVVGASDASMRSAVVLGGKVGLGGHGVFWALVLLGFVLFGIAGWWLLRLLGRWYEQRRMSDQGLTLDAMWLLFGVVQSVTFAFEGLLYVFTGLMGFVIYKLVAQGGFELAGLARGDAASPTLLLLRVFALGGRSERLFDAFSKRWLRAGSIFMIAGPDLAASTVEPHEFLDYMAGRLSRRFVSSGEDLERRLRAVEQGPDPDGRYRVNEFFCYADTWQQTMTRLAARADAVLMDLRSFSPSNQGCMFELQQLLDSVSLDRVVFLIDDTTDRAFLENVLHESWVRVDPASPNRGLAAPRARLLRVSDEQPAGITGALKLLLAGSSVQPQPG
jgi:hypothetical protein